MKTRKLGIAPTLVVTVLVLGFALLIGVILLMMYVRTGIEHSPEQASVVLPACPLASHEAGSLSVIAEDVA
ncbi:MAG TPA: hypothetical protein VHQ22_08255 [Terriglobales bacterium]|jgi:hypothetical protein|nr:hypothetical protein [Terriglobales bacterium]